jgi:hypothetical protein
MEALTVDHLAETLQEPKKSLLAAVLKHLGQERTAAVLADTLQREASGGMLTKDGTRRRSPGGTFFTLVKEQLPAKERWKFFHPQAPPRRGPRQPHKQPQRQAPAVLSWVDVEATIQELAQFEPGEARTMKLTLIGRPGKIETKGQAVAFRLQGKPPVSLPRGLPPVPNTPAMTWNVIVALRQWNRVKESLAADKDDQLIIEGYPLQQGNQLVLMAQSCTSIALQRARKEAQRQETTP